MITNDLKKTIDYLLKQKPVVIFQGESEIGLRALGNRSILFDPRNKDAQKIINTMKGREWWRPLAGTILLEHTHKYFELGTLEESPHMSFALPAKERAKKEVPSIVHVDGTSRMQTVTKQQNKNYYNLINQFYKKTKVPMVLNTSFNVAGFPIVEDLDFAVWSCNKMNIELIYNPI
tara:strand:- start:87 stop:614 length:528 start_codon:yes stop_codon:yes gene_type:complete